MVDAWAAQHADAATPPTKFFFALAGLCLLADHGFTGRAIQRAHATLAKSPESWPIPALPASRGALTVLDVASADAGQARNARIVEWARAVWTVYAGHRAAIEQLLRTRGVI